MRPTPTPSRRVRGRLQQPGDLSIQLGARRQRSADADRLRRVEDPAAEAQLRQPCRQRIGGHPVRNGRIRDDGDTLWFGEDQIRWGRGSRIDSEAIVLVRPSPYPTADDDKLTWGATFSLEHRPNAVLANFKGYDPSKMFAQDFQATTGADELLFKMPDDASTDYTATDSRLIVPHGLYSTSTARAPSGAMP